MSIESRFVAYSCSGCDNDPTTPAGEVRWDIQYVKKNGDTRDVGWLLEKEIDAYNERVRKTSSSSTCPDCASIGMTNGDVEKMRESLLERNKVPEFNVNLWVDQYNRFQDRLAGKPKNKVNGRQALFY